METDVQSAKQPQPQSKRKPTITSVAQECLEECGNDLHKAQDMMVKKVRSNNRLFHLLLDPMVESACYEALGSCIRQQRSEIWTAPNYSKGGNGQRVLALAEANNLMYFPLGDGKILGNATRAEILEAAERRAKQIKTMAWEERWLRLVAEHLKGRQTLLKSKALTVEQLYELKEEAEHAD